MTNGIHYRERDGKKFAARDPQQMGPIEKAGKLLEYDIDLIKKGKIPGITYDERELRRPVWKKGK